MQHTSGVVFDDGQLLKLVVIATETVRNGDWSSDEVGLNWE